ncbi:MAG: site-2 protease family protein, partial [Muribaculaceae bacterium]|nr:site-2 protease family protein [Muribaculaceae bacterium]
TIFVKATPDENGKLGFMLTPLNEIYPVETVDYSFFAAIPKGIKDGTTQLVTYVGSLKYLFTKSGAQSVGGFGSIGALFPEKWSWYSFWQITAFLSVILAFMNILPIPALDGGHIVFVLYEMGTRRKPSEKVLEYSQMIGLAFLVFLLIYANANDIYRFFIK